MEHLIFVLWTDHWKPWLIRRLQDLAYIALAVAVAGAIAIGWIWATIEMERSLGG